MDAGNTEVLLKSSSASMRAFLHHAHNSYGMTTQAVIPSHHTAYEFLSVTHHQAQFSMWVIVGGRGLQGNHAHTEQHDKRVPTQNFSCLQLQVEGVCRGIMHMLGSMTKEYAKLLTKLAVEQAPLQLGQELHVGQPLSLLQLPKLAWFFK